MSKRVSHQAEIERRQKFDGGVGSFYDFCMGGSCHTPRMEHAEVEKEHSRARQVDPLIKGEGSSLIEALQRVIKNK